MEPDRIEASLRIFLTPQGTHGDVRPVVALGHELRRAGHEVVFGASANHGPWIQDQGFAFHPVGFDLQTPSEQSKRSMGNPIRAVTHALSLLGGLVASQFETLPDAARRADIMMGAGLDFAGRSVAESLHIPYVFACHTPLAAPSIYHPPVTIPYQPRPKWLNRLFWWVSELGVRMTLGKPLNAGRRRLGLAPVRRFGEHFWKGQLVAADELLAPTPADWKQPIRTAYWELPDDRSLDDDLLRFMEDGPAPIFFGFGSMSDPSPGRTRQLIDELSSRYRLVVCNEQARMACERALPNTHWIASAPHSKLFPRMAAVIHHGGAGTTHTAARCGVPQIIVPHIADQYYWGHRVHALGIGAKPLHRRRLSVQSLEAALTSVGPESTVARTATEVAQQLAEQAGDSLRQGVGILLAVSAKKEG